MNREVVKEAATVEDALDEALEELGVQQDAVDFEVVEEPSRKLFGGGRPARVRVWLKDEFLAELEGRQDEVGETFGEGGDEGLQPGEEPAREELSEEELDEVADAAVEALNGVLEAFGVSGSIDEYEGDEGEIILDIVGEDLGILIGRHGRTLDALQTVVSAMTNRKLDRRYPVVVDVEGYRTRRREKLEEIARRAADKAQQQGRPVKLRPMTSFERRVVHIALRDNRKVATASEGDEPYRQVVVTPK